MNPSALEMMRRHVGALYTFDARGRMTGVNQWDGGIAPRFFLGRTAEGQVACLRSDVPDDLVGALSALPASAHDDAYLRLLARRAPVTRVWHGPAFAFVTDVPIHTAGVVAIDESNVDLLRGGLEAWLPDVPHRRPFLAAIEGGRAVSVCASVRITPAAHAAGVETLAAFRGRGHARAVVAAWARAVRGLGALPLYSTSWENMASRAVAARLGMTMFGVDFHVT